MASNKTEKPAASNDAEVGEAEKTKLTPQQEAFACFVASGNSQAEAYRLAYPKSVKWKKAALHEEASRLAQHPEVSLRIKYLRGQVMHRAIEDAVVDKDYITRRLKTVAERCLQAEPVFDKKGDPVYVETPDGEVARAFVFNANGANRALELLGKEAGMFIERKESGKPGDFADQNVDVVRKRVAEKAARHGLKVVPLTAAAKKASG